MTKSLELVDFERWKAANEGVPFSIADYVHAKLSHDRAHADTLVAIAWLLWPRFIERDALVYLEAQFDPERLSGLRASGVNGHLLEYWMNLFCVDGLFAGIENGTTTHAVSLAETLAEAWAAKLSRDFPTRCFDTRVVTDAQEGDVCVVFNQLPSTAEHERSIVGGETPTTSDGR